MISKKNAIRSMLEANELSGQKDSIAMRVVSAMRNSPDCPNLFFALDHVVEQAEDIVTILISEHEVAHIEVSRVSPDVLITREPLVAFRRRVSKRQRKIIEEALELIRV